MRYEMPTTIENAVRLLSDEKGSTQILAGGTDFLVQLNSGAVGPDLIVDIKGVPELTRISAEDGGYRIGAGVSCAELCEHAGIGEMWPGIIEAANLIGSTQIQGRATIAGNLCNASPAADAVPALLAADAIVTIAHPNGRREMGIGDIATGPGQTSLAPTDIVHSIFLPSRPPRSGDAYQRFIPRTEMDIAVVGVGINLTLDENNTCTSARVALCAVAQTVVLALEAAEILIGSTGDQATLDRLASAASAACRPIDDKRGTKNFRIKVAGVLAKRVATLAFERAGGHQ
jgi:CO/xanthine dehydrogenase FAD-binding subunit